LVGDVLSRLDESWQAGEPADVLEDFLARRATVAPLTLGIERPASFDPASLHEILKNLDLELTRPIVDELGPPPRRPPAGAPGWADAVNPRLEDLGRVSLSGRAAVDDVIPRRWERKQAADRSDVSAGQLYTDLRRLTIADGAIERGQIFAWEAVTEEAPLFARWSWSFRGEYPCALSRFELHVPAGLDVDVHEAHLDSVRAAHAAGSWSWELRDQPAAPSEPLAPIRPDLGPHLCVRAVGTDGDRSPPGLSLGRLDATWEESDGALIMKRHWELQPVTVGPERWADVRSLLLAYRASNEATVVLVRR
jgi:hypothetical protein